MESGHTPTSKPQGVSLSGEQAQWFPFLEVQDLRAQKRRPPKSHPPPSRGGGTGRTEGKRKEPGGRSPLHICMDAGLYVRMDGWMDGCMDNRWMDEWMGGWVDGWLENQRIFLVYINAKKNSQTYLFGYLGLLSKKNPQRLCEEYGENIQQNTATRNGLWPTNNARREEARGRGGRDGSLPPFAGAPLPGKGWEAKPASDGGKLTDG